MAIMLKEVGLIDEEGARAQIVPLFETIEDLDNSAILWRNIYSLPIAQNDCFKNNYQKSCWATQTVTRMVDIIIMLTLTRPATTDSYW